MKTEDLPIVKALQGENVDSMEMFVQHYQKTEGTFVIISARPLKDFLWQITRAVRVFHDITERKKTENLIIKLMKT